MKIFFLEKELLCVSTTITNKTNCKLSAAVAPLTSSDKCAAIQDCFITRATIIYCSWSSLNPQVQSSYTKQPQASKPLASNKTICCKTTLN